MQRRALATLFALAAFVAASAEARAQGALVPAVATKPSKGTIVAAKPKAGPAPRIRAVAKSPVASLASRGSNPTGPFARLNEMQRDSIIENSRALLGIKYKWAGETPERGMDCSGFVRYVFKKFGLDLPHSSAILAKVGEPVMRDTSEMRVGDLLVFSKLKSKRISHVGIYVGDGMMVHASSTSKQVVETPIVEYRDKMNLRGVRRVIAVDSAVAIPQP
jgi:cell wall-associated NlpC family hydrolase